MIRLTTRALATLAVVTAAASVRCTSPTAPLPLQENIGGTWTLTALQRVGQAEVTPPVGTTFAMEIADGRATVTADCNRCTGAAVVGTDTLTIGPILACTRAFCPSAPFDDTFVRMLGGESAATIDGSRLTLRSDRGVLRFRR
jgi:heat shock protein HslJ